MAPALHCDRERWRLPWARVLSAQAEAHRANALRVAGDLDSAGSIFADLRRELSLDPLDDLAATAEILSLEASLAIGQRNLRYADFLLRLTADHHRTVGDRVAEAKTLIQHANLQQTQLRPAEVLLTVEKAVALFDPEAEPELHRSAVQVRLNALLDLGRAEDADMLFHRKGHVYLEAEGDSYMAAMHRAMKARVALALGRHDDAIPAFEEARDRLFDLGRDYDAILASLYLADAHLAAGQLTEVQSLAADLVQLFEAKGVAQEMLASLRLLTQATRSTEAALAAVLADLRERLGGQSDRFEGTGR